MSRLQSYLTNEEYLTRLKGLGKVKSYEVFLNPSKKEMKELPVNIRFIAHIKEKKIYVWDAFAGLHDDVWQELRHKDLRADISSGKIIAGTIEDRGIGKYELIEWDGDEHMITFINKLDINGLDKFANKIKWIDKYFDITKSFKESMMERL